MHSILSRLTNGLFLQIRQCDTPQKDKQINKRPHITDTFEEETHVDTDHEELDMSVQELLSDMNKRLDNVATKDDISEMKRELQLLTQTFTEKIEKLEGTECLRQKQKPKRWRKNGQVKERK